jgi:hypothetical protein
MSLPSYWCPSRYYCERSWRNGIQQLTILYLDVIAAGEQIRMSKLSEPRVKNTIVKIV